MRRVTRATGLYMAEDEDEDDDDDDDTKGRSLADGQRR